MRFVKPPLMRRRPGLELRLGLRTLYILPTRFGLLWLATAGLLYLVGLQMRSNGSLLLVGTAHGATHGAASERPFAARVVSSGPKLRLGPRSYLEMPDAEPWAERRAAANAIWLVDAGAWGATREVWAVYCKRRPLGREERALQRVKRALELPKLRLHLRLTTPLILHQK